MSEGRGGEVRTGLFVICGVLLLVLLSLWVAGTDPWGPERTRHVVSMPDAGGLRVGDPVRVAGVSVGRVVAVELRADPAAPVAFGIELDSGAPVGRESSAFFGSDSLLGSRFLALEPRSAEQAQIRDGDPLRGVMTPSMTEAMGSFGAAMGDAKVLLAEMSELVRGLNERGLPILDRVEALTSEENARELTRALGALRGTLEESGPRIPELLDRLEQTLTSIDRGAQGLPEVTGQATALLIDLRSALGPDGERLGTLLESADATLGSADRTLGAVAGSVGDLEAAMRDLRAAADHLEELTRTLEERPNRLIVPSRRKDRRPGEGIQP